MTSGEAADLRAIRASLSRGYIETITRVCRHFEVDLDEIWISRREFRLALEEAEIDVRALLMRRSPSHGVSEGKVAGMYAWRLSRFKIVHLAEHLAERSHLHIIQDLAALLVVKKCILRAQVGTERIKELAFQLSRRHANQETLGLCFDVLKDAYVAGLIDRDSRR